jgi:UDP-N-acetylglucosamine 2-epimerase (non-hydrolysing)
VKVLTVLGTRPEIIRLSRVIEKLDGVCEHVLVHTGQNFDPRLSDLFFEELGVRRPDRHLGISGATFGEQIGRMLAAVDVVLREEQPDALLVLGDTNSGLCAVLAKRMGIRVYHMEAGNRCFDDRVPEEVNRRVIDHSSSVLMPYTRHSRENLLREGVPGDRIYVTGNPIHEVLEHYAPQIDAAPVFERFGVEPGRYFLATMHRAENVDVDGRLRDLAAALERVSRDYDLPVLCSLHPRTQQKMREFGVEVADQRVRFLEPIGLFDFVALERRAFCTLSDSGTVQEECCLFRVPTVTLRDVTERPETVECGSNMLAGVNPETVLQCVRVVTATPPAWSPPPEYLTPDVSSAVVKIVLGYLWEGRVS